MTFKERHYKRYGYGKVISNTKGYDAYERPRQYTLTLIEVYHRTGESNYSWLRDNSGSIYMIRRRISLGTAEVIVGETVRVTAKRKRNGTLDGIRYTELWYPKITPVKSE